MSIDNHPNSSIFDSLCSYSPAELEENKFYLSRLKQLIDKNPQQFFNQLFFDYYWQSDQLELMTVIKRLRLVADQIKMPILNYLIYLEQPYNSALNNFTEQKELCQFIRKIRATLKDLIKKEITHNQTSQKTQPKIKTGLKHVNQFDTYAERRFEIADRGFNSREVIENISNYLSKAQPLADLAYFDDLYFCREKLKPIRNQLNQRSFNKFIQKFIKNKLLTTSKKEKILNHLQNFITQSFLDQQSKRAYAVYLTLGISIPWEKHHFTKRLILNSHLEAKIKQL